MVGDDDDEEEEDDAADDEADDDEEEEEEEEDDDDHQDEDDVMMTPSCITGSIAFWVKLVWTVRLQHWCDLRISVGLAFETSQ